MTGPAGQPTFVDPLTGRPLSPGENPVRGVPAGTQAGEPPPGPPPLAPLPPAPLSPAPRNRLPGRVAVGIGATVAVVAAVVVGANSGDRDAGTAAPPTAVPTTRGRVPLPSLPNPSRLLPPTPTGPTSVRDIMVPAVTPGWQGVLSPAERIAYDVPPDWRIESPGVVTGFEGPDNKPSVTMHGVSTYRPNACSDSRGSYRGRVGFAGGTRGMPAASAIAGARTWAEAAGAGEDGTAPTVTLGQPKQLTLPSGFTATRADATVVPVEESDCPAPTYGITAVAFEHSGRTVMFIVLVDLQVPDAAPPADLDAIIQSLRPHRG